MAKLPKDFGPDHPDWKIPSKRNRYLMENPHVNDKFVKYPIDVQAPLNEPLPIVEGLRSGHLPTEEELKALEVGGSGGLYVTRDEEIPPTLTPKEVEALDDGNPIEDGLVITEKTEDKLSSPEENGKNVDCDTKPEDQKLDIEEKPENK